MLAAAKSCGHAQLTKCIDVYFSISLTLQQVYISYEQYYHLYMQVISLRRSAKVIHPDREDSSDNQDTQRAHVICWAVGGCLTGPR